MEDNTNRFIMTINSGSSSIKFALYRMGSSEEAVISGSISGVGIDSGMFHVKDGEGRVLIKKALRLRDHGHALKELTGWLHGIREYSFSAIGHRIVHGGSRFSEPSLVTPRIIEAFKKLIPLAPEHLPHEILAIEEFRRSYPDVKQAACFDTAFHREMPEAAKLYALPEDLTCEGVMRYGFHGLSYEYIMDELYSRDGASVSMDRIIIAHLGNGASMTAIRDGKSIDTTMGFSPAGGLVMSTRTGDLDPGVILYLLKEKKLEFAALNRLVNKQGGLMGVSGISSDVKELLDAEAKNKSAAGALELFCYQAKKFLGAFIAVLGGLDTLIFTGGIGENAPLIRKRICKDMEYAGIHIDNELNNQNSPVISSEGCAVKVRVMKTNEELMIARHTYNLLYKKEKAGTGT